MVRRKHNIARLRTGIFVGAIVVAVIVGGCGLYYGLGSFGEPYRTLDKPDAEGDVEVVVYFSYTCPHCRSLEALIDDWRETLPEGVALKRVHVAYPEQNRLLAKAYVALERHGAVAANHERIFRAIHDRNRRFGSLAEVANLVDGYGIDRTTFLRTGGSARVARETDASHREFVSLGLLSVPAMVIDGKYVLNMGQGRKQVLAVAAELAQELLAERGES